MGLSYPTLKCSSFFWQYIIIPKKNFGQNQKRTTLEPLATVDDINPASLNIQYITRISVVLLSKVRQDSYHQQQGLGLAHMRYGQ